MRCAIDGPCRPAALVALGLEERDAIDLEEGLGLFDKTSTAWLGLRTLFRGLFRGSWGLGFLSLLPGPRPRIAEIGASRQTVIAAKAHAASCLQGARPEELSGDGIARKGRPQHASDLAAAFAIDQILFGNESDALAGPFRRGRLGGTFRTSRIKRRHDRPRPSIVPARSLGRCFAASANEARLVFGVCDEPARRRKSWNC
jgi:hypothetical protein